MRVDTEVCPVTLRSLAAVWIVCSLAWGQQTTPDWQAQVRKYAQQQDWNAAMHIVDLEVARTPQDMDVRAWRARVLLWSGQLADAEREFREILAAVPQDPDNWMGLASVYSREGRTQDAEKALERALELDPKRADIHAARGRVLRDLRQLEDAKMEFRRALELDPQNTEARTGLLSLRGEAKHELRFGVDTDLFSFAEANHDGGVSLTSQWTSHWATTAAGSFYRRAGTNAGGFSGAVTGKSAAWGALTVGAATADDNGVIPRAETFFDYDRGWKIGRSEWVRGLEIDYGQHWYWYSSARILTLHEATTLYLPRDWSWSLALIGARSYFTGDGTDWRPSGYSKINFPITGTEQRGLVGNLFYAVGTEDFAEVDQIGRFASHTYGGGLRFRLTPLQDVTGFAAYQKRIPDRTETSFGFTYGIRF